MDIKQLMAEMVTKNASDLFYRTGAFPFLRIDGRIVPVESNVITPADSVRAVEEITTVSQRKHFHNSLDVDFALYSEEFKRRFRVSIFMQRGHPSIVIRNVRGNIQTFEELNLPADVLKRLCAEPRGLVLLTGSMGSGKSTTIASMVEYINQNWAKHILTIEEPIEYTFQDKKSIVNQRELGLDVSSYAAALRSFTLQSPDVIYIGNIRDEETMSAALTIAETGVLVLSTVHTINAGQSVERIINFYPPHQRSQIRRQLAALLKGVISLRLVPLKSGVGRIPAYEVMIMTPTIGRLIVEEKVKEIHQFMEEGTIFGMQSFRQSLLKMVKEDLISMEDAIFFADNKDEFNLSLNGIKK